MFPFRKKNRTPKTLRHLGLSFKMAPDFIEKIILTIGIVFTWRGLWNLTDKYFLPNHFIVSNVVCVIIGLVLIYLPDEQIEGRK